MRLVVAIAGAGVGGTTADGGDCFGFAVRQCLSYLIPNKTIKYSISAKNTNNVQDISHTWKWNEIEEKKNRIESRRLEWPLQ